jgi:hypothetical protein
MMAEGQVSVGASLAYGWRLWAANWRSIWGVLALTSLTMTVYMAGIYAPNQDLLIAGGVAQLITQPMLYGAVFRIAFADRHGGDPAFAGGHAGLQWRPMEWRILGTSLLLTLLFVLFVLLAFVLVGSVALGVIVSHGGRTPPLTPQAAMNALGADGKTVMTFVLAAALFVLVFLYVRLSLAFAATADRGKISVLETWPLTKGQFWRILIALLVVQLPLTLVQSLITTAAADGTTIGSVPGGMAPTPALVSALVTGVVYGGLIAPITAGILAYYYRTLAPPPPPADGLPEARP